MFQILENIFLIAVTAVIGYYFFIRKDESQKAEKEAQESFRVRDLFFYKSIAKDGLIELPGQQFRRMYEITPTNLTLKSPNEEALVWDEWRKTIDAVPIPMTVIEQTRMMEMTDYIEEVQREARKLHEEERPLMHEYASAIVDEFRETYQEQGRRERKYFIILNIDGADFLKEEATLGTDNVIGTAMMGSFSKKGKYTEEEIKNIAISEMDNAALLLTNGLSKCGVGARPMDKLSVLDYINNAVNRDLASIHSIRKMDRMGVLNFKPTSETIEHYFTQEALDIMEHIDELSMFEEPESYPDETMDSERLKAANE